MPKGEKLPSGKVRYRIYIGRDASGKKRYKSFTAETRRAAQKAAQMWLAVNPQDGPNISLAEACEHFLEGRNGTLSPSTWADYNHRIEYLKKLFPDFFKLQIGVIDDERIQWMVNALAKKTNDNSHSRSISPKTVRAYYGLLRAVLRSQGIGIGNVQLPQYQRPDLNIPEEDLVRQLLASVAGTHLEVPVLLAALGPMRRGEICALSMGDIDFDTNTVHVRRNMVVNSSGQWVIKQPKSGAGQRDIQYPAMVIDKIRQQGYITHCNPDTITGNFSRHLARHGLPHFRFHDLRHYAASFLLALNIPPVYVMERGGWESEQTMKRYVHVLDKQRKEYADKASAAFSSLL